MLFNSLTFLYAFLPITYFVFWWLRTKEQRYRWMALAEGGPPIAALLDGDSFSAGSGLSDDETVSARLTAMTGRTVYNIAGEGPSRLPDIRRMARLLHMERGLVIYEHYDLLDIPPGAALRPRYQVPSSEPEPAAVRLERAWQDLQPSRLQILGTWAAGGPLGPPPGGTYGERLEAGLRSAGVKVVNLLGPFRERAARDLPQGRYLYRLDDTHWNESGAALAAELIRDAWHAPGR